MISIPLLVIRLGFTTVKKEGEEKNGKS